MTAPGINLGPKRTITVQDVSGEVPASSVKLGEERMFPFKICQNKFGQASEPLGFGMAFSNKLKYHGSCTLPEK
jgi:hypothetical protein